MVPRTLKPGGRRLPPNRAPTLIRESLLSLYSEIRFQAAQYLSKTNSFWGLLFFVYTVFITMHTQTNLRLIETLLRNLRDIVLRPELKSLSNIPQNPNKYWHKKYSVIVCRLKMSCSVSFQFSTINIC